MFSRLKNCRAFGFLPKDFASGLFDEINCPLHLSHLEAESPSFKAECH